MVKTKYTYDIATETLNGQVDSGVLQTEILAGPFTGFLYIGTGDGYCDCFFDPALSGEDETVLDGYLAVHDGYSTTAEFQFWEKNPQTTTTSETFVETFSRTANTLSVGIYRLSWYFEMKVTADGAINSNGMGQFLVDANVKGSCNMRREEWHAFSGWDRYVASEGDAPVLSFEMQRDPTEAGNDTIAMRKMKLGIEYMGAN
jgi:hypothetical protein